MASCTHLAALALLLLALAPPARAATWRRIGTATDSRRWVVSVLPSGVGFAAGRNPSTSAFPGFERTLDEGRTWRAAATPPKNNFPFRFHTLPNGSALLAFSFSQKSVENALLWSDATKKWSNRALEVPTGIRSSGARVQLSATVPGASQAFATGTITTSNNRTVNCVWHWNGGASWRVTQTPVRLPSGLKAASSTAAWLSFNNPGDIFRWNRNAWAQIRRGTKGETLELLKAIPAAAGSQPLAWAKLTSSQGAQTLLLCDSTRCTAKKAAQTGGKYPGRFLAFDASSPSFALVWELAPNAGSPLVVLHQYDGRGWTRFAEANAEVYFRGTELKVDPQPLVSTASPARAIATLTYFTKPGTAAAKLLETYVWNGAKWAYEEEVARFTAQEVGSGAGEWTLQALNSGGALLAKATGRWRLA